MAASSPPPGDFVISVAFSSGGPFGRTQTYRFDANMTLEEPHLMWLYLAPRRVPEARKGCVTISFDPKPTRRSLRDGEGRAAILQSLYFDGRCSVADDPPLDPKHGTRAMLLGAVHVFRHLVRTWWPHVTELHLSDESTFKCAPRFGNKIRTYATDLLTGDLTYYERHLGASLSSSSARERRAEVRRRITSPVDATGADFWSSMSSPSTPWDRRQERWMKENGAAVVELLDAVRAAGGTWQDFFGEVRAKYGCDMYACCSEQLVTFFKMSRLMGAGYEVKLDDLRGASTVASSADASATDRRIHTTVHAGGGGGGIRSASTRASTNASTRMHRLMSAVRGSLYLGHAVPSAPRQTSRRRASLHKA